MNGRTRREVRPCLAGQKGFVDRVDLDAGDQRAQRRHHPPRHVAVEGEVGREDCHLPPLDERPHLVEGLPHADAEGFGLVRAGDDAAVVVREHHDGASHEVGPEDPLAGGIEVIAVGKGEHILSLIFQLYESFKMYTTPKVQIITQYISTYAHIVRGMLWAKVRYVA